jgi:8-oxo-dGTP diphosphatase
MHHQFKLMMHTDLKGFESVNADGLHLPFREVQRYAQRPVDKEKLLGISCHSPSEVDAALRLSPNFICLSPVKPTASHPGMPSLGWDRFQQWLEAIPVPVYALGGLSLSDLPQALRMGAHGIACIGDWWPLQS